MDDTKETKSRHKCQSCDEPILDSDTEDKFRSMNKSTAKKYYIIQKLANGKWMELDRLHPHDSVYETKCMANARAQALAKITLLPYRVLTITRYDKVEYHVSIEMEC